MKEITRETEFIKEFSKLGITRILYDLKIPRPNFYKRSISREREKLIALTIANTLKDLLSRYEDIINE